MRNTNGNSDRRGTRRGRGAWVEAGGNAQLASLDLVAEADLLAVQRGVAPRPPAVLAARLRQLLEDVVNRGDDD